MRRPHRQRMSSAANALLCNIAEGKQCNLLSYFSAHTRPPQRLNRAPKAGLAKSRGRHGSLPHCAHRRPNFTGDRSEARGHGAAHAALPPGSLHAGCACWCAPDGFAARQRRGGTQGACNAGRRAPRRPSAGVELADGVIEAAQGRRARAPRAHRCTGRSRTTPSAHSATFFGSCKMPNSSILPWGKALMGPFPEPKGAQTFRRKSSTF